MMIEWRIFKICFNLQTLREIVFFIFSFSVLPLLKAPAVPLVVAVKRSAGKQDSLKFCKSKNG